MFPSLSITLNDVVEPDSYLDGSPAPGLFITASGLISAASEAFANASVHTLVLQGEGRHFCTGLDLSDLATLSDADLLLRLVRIETLLAMLWHAPIRTVAQAKGRTWGAGADLLVACEQRLVGSDTTLRFPGAQFGLVLGTRRLAERIGADAARALVLEGGELDATQALALGLASRITDSLALAPLRTSGDTGRAVRAASRSDLRDADFHGRRKVPPKLKHAKEKRISRGHGTCSLGF